jgi:outer membrane murein-binding lipoprotein Lpp
MKNKNIAAAILFAAYALAGCHTVKPIKSSITPSTAAVGADLDKLSQSLDSAKKNVDATRAKLSEVDAKAVRIQESIRNW